MSSLDLHLSHLNACRCPWCGDDPLYVTYHDTVWGRPVLDSQELFAKLCLDGQQAGLSWITILRKQPAYEEAFHGFDPERVASLSEVEQAGLLSNPGIVRNRLKIASIIRNAKAYLRLQERGVAFNDFLWQFVDYRSLVNQFESMREVPAETALSREVSRALKSEGFNFVGPTIVYAFMQATGLVNDHLIGCEQYAVCAELALSARSLID